jgi:hypothetical protein
MGKFKVNDKVRFTSGYAKSIGNLVGLEGVVNGYDPNNNLGVLLSTGHIMPAAEEELGKVEEKEMEYEVGKPYLWFGGECPVPYGTSVSIRFGTKNFDYIEDWWTYTEYAHDIDWQHEYKDDNILMFKVVEYPKKTRKVELELSEEEITTIKEVLEKLNT